MSNKPSYAAVAAKSTSEDGSNQVVRQGEAPPPYSGPSQIPHQTHLPPQLPVIPNRSSSHVGQPGQIYHPGSHESQQDGSDWVPPSSLAVAKSRALRRFWMAFIWAWLIWVALGLLIGGGISDVEQNPPGRHGHWDKHGHWRENAWTTITSFIPNSSEKSTS